MPYTTRMPIICSRKEGGKRGRERKSDAFFPLPLSALGAFAISVPNDEGVCTFAKGSRTLSKTIDFPEFTLDYQRIDLCIKEIKQGKLADSNIPNRLRSLLPIEGDEPRPDPTLSVVWGLDVPNSSAGSGGASTEREEDGRGDREEWLLWRERWIVARNTCRNDEWEAPR